MTLPLFLGPGEAKAKTVSNISGKGNKIEAAIAIGLSAPTAPAEFLSSDYNTHTPLSLERAGQEGESSETNL